jgi:histidyl-tRNA synthetase
MSDKQSTKPPSGTRDFLPNDIRRREHVVGVIRRVYEQYGFEPLETPAFENIETLLGKYGEEGNKLIFKILKRGEHERTGEADLALRYDLTVPLARVVAQYQNEIPKFFKRYQIQPVWRADRPARGRFREFYQCDIDSIGSTSAVIEADILGAVADVLQCLGFRDFAIRLNHRLVLAGLLNVAGVGVDRQADALVALDKLDKIGVEGVEREFVARGIEPAVTAKCLEFFDAAGGERPQDMLDRLAGILGAADASVENLRAIVGLAESNGAGGHLRIDPSLARGLSYYTGAIMEVTVPDLAGSLGGGGRYDSLVGMFLGRDVPACGFSLGLERIIVVMTERNMFPGTVAGAVDVLVTMWADSDLRREAVKLATELRDAGLCVETYPEADKIGKQFKYAADRRIPFVAVQGDTERGSSVVTIKNLATGVQDAVPRVDAAAFIERTLAVKP